MVGAIQMTIRCLSNHSVVVERQHEAAHNHYPLVFDVVLASVAVVAEDECDDQQLVGCCGVPPDDDDADDATPTTMTTPTSPAAARQGHEWAPPHRWRCW